MALNKNRQETKGCFTVGKVGNLNNLDFLWKADIIHIPRLRPNSKICSLVGRNK